MKSYICSMCGQDMKITFLFGLVSKIFGMYEIYYKEMLKG